MARLIDDAGRLQLTLGQVYRFNVKASRHYAWVLAKRTARCTVLIAKALTGNAVALAPTALTSRLVETIYDSPIVTDSLRPVDDVDPRVFTLAEFVGGKPRPFKRLIRGCLYTGTTMEGDQRIAHGPVSLYLGQNAQVFDDDFNVMDGQAVWWDLGFTDYDPGLMVTELHGFPDVLTDEPDPEVIINDMNQGVFHGDHCLGRLLPPSWFTAHRVIASPRGIINFGPRMDPERAWAIMQLL